MWDRESQDLLTLEKYHGDKQGVEAGKENTFVRWTEERTVRG